MSQPQQFDEVRLKAATAIFRLGYREYDRGLTVREEKPPRGWIVSAGKPDQMVNPKRLRDAIRYFDIFLELWPDLAGADGNARTALNLKAITLRALGELEAARSLHAQVLAAAKQAGDKPMQEVSEEGIRYCDEHLQKN